MQDLKPQRAVESDSSWHFVGAQCDRADPLDHGQNSPVLFPCAAGSRHFFTGQNKAECATHWLTAPPMAIDEAGSWANLYVRLKRISHQKPIRRTTLVPIGRKSFSRICAARRLASITTLPVRPFCGMLRPALGERTTAVCRTVSN